MRYQVILLPRAELDLEQQALWWADHHSIDQALRWLEIVREQLATLEQFPERHAVSAENDLFPFEIRDKLIGSGTQLSHRAVFAIRESNVFILTVRHTAQISLTPDDLASPLS